jgi:hypothetical protein
MFMLWAIPAGLVLGALFGGTIEALSAVHFRWAPLAVVALLVQVVLFTPLGDQLTGGFGPAIYVISTAAVFVAVLRNLGLPGMPIVGLGALSNLAAIAANGGVMPADADALAAAGIQQKAGEFANSTAVAHPHLGFLGDVFAVPSSWPVSNVFSVGDVVLVIAALLALHSVCASRLALPRSAA